MKQEIALKHEFVEFIPEELKEGTVYVSIRFATVSHLCVCGCKNKVVTPLRPADWPTSWTLGPNNTRQRWESAAGAAEIRTMHEWDSKDGHEGSARCSALHREVRVSDYDSLI